MGLCRGGGHQEFAGVWFSYKWKPCVSLALHVPMSGAFMCLELVTGDEGKPGLTNSHLLLHPYCPRVSTLSLLFIFLPLLFCVLLKTSLRSRKPSYVQCLSVYFFFFFCFFPPIFSKKTTQHGNHDYFLLFEDMRGPFAPGNCPHWQEILNLLLGLKVIIS